MFFHILRYGLRSLLRDKVFLFWSLSFSFLLATFMYMAFGNIFETTEKFDPIAVAVVEERKNEVLEEVLASLSEEGEDQILKITQADDKKAKKLLEEEKVTAILYENVNAHLVVRENGMKESILQMLMSRIKQTTVAMTEVSLKHPENIQQAVAGMEQEVSYCVQKNYGSGNQDNVVNYFYAIFAMTCLFASFSSYSRTSTLQANFCALGIRRGVTPTPKMVILLVEFLMSETMQFLVTCLLYVYLRFVLGIQIGDDYLAIGILLLLGTSLGTMFGIFIGALPKLSDGTRVGILVSVSLILCACSDLMASGVRDLLEHKAPLVNDLNPAALICDSFYALNVYDGYGRFTSNMLILAMHIVVLAVISFFMVRRSQYASL
ncbi:MAG: ABC transporter permease [Lachnospiraceae bacterium]|nr:ABC transporter permease [Lachnospiraceae bacterium]